MKTTRILGATGALLSTAFLFALAPVAQAAPAPLPDLVYTLTLNVSQLNANPNGPFTLALQLAEGSGNVTNTVTLSNFVFTGGSAATTPNFTSGGETGSIASGITLTNSALDNEYDVAFGTGVTQISFKVDQTPNSEVVTSGTPIPDQFNVALLDGNYNNVPTTDPSGNNVLVSSALGSNATLATVNQYAVVAAPEPSSAAMFLVGAGSLLGFLGLRRRRSA